MRRELHGASPALRHAIADRLLKIAARRSVETSFGWSHDDCAVLQEAARILKNEPVPEINKLPVGVLSTD